MSNIESSPPMLDIANLHAWYGESHILHGTTQNLADRYYAIEHGTVVTVVQKEEIAALRNELNALLGV